MGNVIQFKRSAPKAQPQVPTEVMCLYLDSAMSLRCYLLTIGRVEVGLQLNPYIREALNNDWVTVEINDEALKTELNALLDNKNNDYLFWKQLYEKNCEAVDDE